MSSFYFWHWRICVLMRLNKGAFSFCCNLKEISVSPLNSYYYSENNSLIEKENQELILGCKNSVIPFVVKK